METPDIKASIFKNRKTTLNRIKNFISPTSFTDVNLYGKLYPASAPIDNISHWMVPGKGAGAWEQWKFEDIIKQEFSPVKIGDKFGPTWTTHWFKLEFNPKDEWANKEIRLRWKSGSEAMVWSDNGEPLQGLSSAISYQLRIDFVITKNYVPSLENKIYYVEMACNTMFGAGATQIGPPLPDKYFTLEMAQISTFDRDIYSLVKDIEILYGLAKELEDDQRGFNAMYAANQMINDIIGGNMTKAAEIGKEFFSRGNGQMALSLAAIGNCHIDSAWLWPFSETKRKCARSFSSTIRLIDDYPEMVFACSQAQQFDWVRQYYPSLFKKMQEKAANNKFVPVGCVWVEMDGLMPSGESFIRQFLYGQKFYEKEFNMRCKEFWLPDTFGYSGQIPQICKHFDIHRFLTQKLSWSLVNKFPNHTFIWEGIDGSSVLAHFPPGDSYEMNVEVDEALRSEKNLRDKGRVKEAAFLYGYGDGGGGPTEDMLERARRLKDVDGCPKITHMTPDEFFQRVEKTKHNLVRWAGELYLELHNATYTSQAFTKQQNRHSEFAMRTSELLLAMVAAQKLAKSDDIRRLQTNCELAWKKILLNQFHDVLPGSSIGLVYKDSNKLYEEALLDKAKKVTDYSIQKLSKGENNDKNYIINTFPWEVQQVVLLNMKYAAVEAPPMSFLEAKLVDPPAVKLTLGDGFFQLENQNICAQISLFGEVLMLKDKLNGSRDVFEKPNGEKGKGNLLTFYDDVPLYWDAWDVMDYHLETRKILNNKANESNIDKLEKIKEEPLRVELEWVLEISPKSVLRQKIILTAVDSYLTFENELNWDEAHKFLKVEFDTGILSREATFDIQFGHLKRPTHFNTSWDSAKYETCGHKWADLSEYDCGMAVLNNCKYGWSSRGSILSLSLVRAPKSPDDTCDIGEHKFSYAIMPHKGSFQKAKVVEASYEFHAPLIVLNETPIGCKNWMEIEGDGVMIEAVKVAEDSTDQVVLRLHEYYGGHSNIKLKVAKCLAMTQADDCNGMEEMRENLPIESNNNDFEIISLKFWPFQIRTIKLTFSSSIQNAQNSDEEFVVI